MSPVKLPPDKSVRLRDDPQLATQSRELTDLFRSLAAIITPDGEPLHSPSPIASEALAQSEELLKASFGAAYAGLCILDRGLRYVAISQSLAEMSGTPVAEHLHKAVREVLGDVAELIEPQLKVVLATGQPLLRIPITAALPYRPEPNR